VAAPITQREVIVSTTRPDSLKLPPLTSYSLTGGVDSIVATQDNNQFVAFVGGAIDDPGDTTLNPGDSLTGFGAHNLLYLVSDAGADGESALPTGVTVSGIQTVQIIANDTYTADVSSGWTGLEDLYIRETFNAPITVNTGALDLAVHVTVDPAKLTGHATAVTLLGSGTVTLDAAHALSNLKTIDASGFTGTLTADLTGDKLAYKGGSGDDTVIIDKAPARGTPLDGGAGANTLKLGADHLAILTPTAMANLHNFQTLQLASGFTEGQTLDLSPVAPFFPQIDIEAGATDLTVDTGQAGRVSVGGSGSLSLNAANAVSLTAVDASGDSGSVTADLSGDNAAYQGGSGNDLVTIDHDPAASLDGGAGANTLRMSGATFSQLTPSGLSHVTNFQTLDIEGRLANGQVLDLAAASPVFDNLVVAGAGDLTLDFDQVAGLGAVTVSGNGTLALNAANVASLSAIDLSGVSGTVTADLRGDNAAYKGGAGNDRVTIDHDPAAAIDGGAGVNTLQLAANEVDGLTAAGMSKVTNFQTLDITGGFVNGLALHLAGADAASFGTIDIEAGAASNLAIDFGQAPALTSVTLSGGVVNTSDTINLSGTNASFLGGAELDLVQIDHAPTGQAIDGGASGSANFLELVGDHIDLGTFTASSLTGVKNFNGLDIHGTFLDGKTFNAAPIGGFFTQFEIQGSDAVTGPDAQGIAIINAPSSLGLKIVTSPGAPVTYDGGTTPSITLETLTKGADVTAAIINHTAASVSIQSFEDDLFNATNHLAANFSNATSLTITGFANLDMTGSSLAKVTRIDDSTAHGTLTVDISTSGETVKLGFGGAVLGNAVAGTVVDFAVTGVAETNGTSALGGALAAGADLASSLDAAMTGKGHVSWFEFAGDSFIVEDVSGGAQFSGGSDMMVELTCLHDLSNAQFNTAHSILL